MIIIIYSTKVIGGATCPNKARFISFAALAASNIAFGFNINVAISVSSKIALALLWSGVNVVVGNGWTTGKVAGGLTTGPGAFGAKGTIKPCAIPRVVLLLINLLWFYIENLLKKRYLMI